MILLQTYIQSKYLFSNYQLISWFITEDFDRVISVLDSFEIIHDKFEIVRIIFQTSVKHF